MDGITIDRPKVRAMRFCLCGSEKDEGCLLCWPCHRREKALNAGGYGDDTLLLLDQMEAGAST